MGRNGFSVLCFLLAQPSSWHTGQFFIFLFKIIKRRNSPLALTGRWKIVTSQALLSSLCFYSKWEEYSASAALQFQLPPSWTECWPSHTQAVCFIVSKCCFFPLTSVSSSNKKGDPDLTKQYCESCWWVQQSYVCTWSLKDYRESTWVGKPK